MRNIELGNIGEELAAKHLVANGCVVLERKFRRVTGEVDIIARDGEYIVFVEVKLRRGLRYGYPREAVGFAKQKKIKQTAMLYLNMKGLHNCGVRFDVIEIMYGGENKPHTLEHLKDAFY